MNYDPNDNAIADADDKIRAAFLITELAPGGAEKALVHLVLSLDRDRFEPVVYTLSGRKKDKENSLAPLLREHGVETIELDMKGPRDLLRTVWKLRKLLKKQAPRLLQSFMFHANIIGRIAAKSAGVPLICAGIRVAERDSKFRLAIDYATRRLCDVWVCVGESVAVFTKSVGKIPSERVVSIPNGALMRNVNGVDSVVASGNVIDAMNGKECCRDKIGTIPQPFGKRKRVIAVGRLAPQKGFDWLLENVNAWMTPEIAKSWELWIVGDGPERERLEGILREKGLGNNVYLAGWRCDVSDLLAESDLFLLPSRWEGMPNALLEAAASGLPTLCANVEGVAEILGDAANNQMCAWGDVRTWNEKIAILLNDERLRRDLGERNRKRVLCEFTVRRSTEKYERLWMELLRKKTRRLDV